MKQKIFILSVCAIVASFACVTLYYQPSQYRSSLAFHILLSNRAETSDYQYDDYYAIKAADLIGDTLMGWFITPSVVLEIFDTASVSQPSKSLRSTTSFFRSKKYSSQNIVVDFTHSSRNDIEKLSNAAIDVIEKRSASLNSNNAKGATFTVQGDEPVIVEVQKSYILVVSISVIIGIMASIFYLYFKRYLQKN